ncbi:PMCA-type calcium-translocating P-type ATPase [Sporodiniella umbellata]|nr:PMCA-type calcium-translocating P-type ATPase [Sporodiniella umbellata]
MYSEDVKQPLVFNGQKTQPFSVTKDQLCRLIEQPKLLSTYGGTMGLCQSLRVDPMLGLSPDESFNHSYGVVAHPHLPFQDRKSTFGKNEISEASPKSFFALLWAAYNDQTLIMLTIASIISLTVGIYEDNSKNHPADEPRVGWVDGVAILGAVAVVVITNAINDYEKEKQFRKLNAKKEERPAKVLRGGLAQQIYIQDIVVGDIMFIEPGDLLNVDCLYIEGHNIRCDESDATGESNPVKKNADGIIISGSKVLQGVAKVLVIAVGENSFYGRAMMLMRHSEDEATPLQLKLNVLADQIAKFGFWAAGLIVLFTKMFVLNYLQNHWISSSELFSTTISIIIQAITVIVVAVPEGLPMAVTMALAFATTEMLKDNNLVRHLSSCETMGNATTVCSDKTGTLTENKMTVVSASVADSEFKKAHEISHWRYQANLTALELLAEGISVNSTAFEGTDAEGKLRYIGSTTECALIELVARLGYSYKEQRVNSHTAMIYPFSSTSKSMTTVIKLNECNAYSPDRSTYRVYTKGAAETIVKACTHYIDASGNVKFLECEERIKQEKMIKTYAERSLRILALAYRDVDQSTLDGFDTDDAPVHRLVLLGIVGIQDQLRPGVIESVQAFRRAGVFIRMITGDNLETAKAIAKECGILTEGGIAMNGPEFRALDINEQYRIIPRLQVLARSSPIDKTIIVSRLQERNEVVAMTGDGTNDGPALKLANVGFAMGLAGTEVAKEASDIILMDDNFNSILQALKWGRAVNDGVRKFLTFQLTVNVAAVVLSFISAVMSEKSESILSAVQLLWVNLIMDTLAALALATEPLTDELVQRKPLRKDSSLINWRMSRMIAGQAIFQIAVNLLLMLHGPVLFSINDTRILRTMVFNVFVFLQVFNELNCRRINDRLNILSGITHDHLFLFIQALVIVSQVLIVQYGGLAFKTVPLNLSQWLVTIGIGALSIPVGILIRLLPKRIPYFWSENNKDEFNHENNYSLVKEEATA